MMSQTPDPLTPVIAELAPGVPALEQSPALALPDSVAEVWARATGSAIVHRALLGPAEAPIAGALLRRRPQTVGSIITGAFGAAVDLEHVVAALVERESEAGHPLLKWEVRPGQSINPAAHGFRPLRTPHRSGDGTEHGIDGWVRDLVDWPRGEVAYYRQTTDFTCGGVSAMLALEAVGEQLLGDDADENRLTELRTWRTATNVPACDPLALAVTVDRLRGDAHRVEVYLDTDEPVLLEELVDPAELSFRADLQRLAARELAERDVVWHHERLGMDELADAVAAGAVAILLIDLEPLIDDPTPHWVIASAERDGVLLIDDPWVETEIGESWVMTHELPMTADALDGVVRWGRGYRGVILLHR